MSEPNDGDVARYYDENTAAFLARGEGRHERVIHRAVWGEGVSNRAQALHFVHELVLRKVETLGADRPRILDLGCGVGASLRYLLDRIPRAEGVGITISGRQIELARAEGHERAAFVLGDFCRDPLPGDVDFAYGIESFVHAPDAGAFFENVASVLRPGGWLALADDFLASGSTELDSVREFVTGWRAPSLLAPEEVDALARRAGLVLGEDRDLTPFLKLRRPRDVAVALAVALARPFARRSLRYQSLAGGNALRICLEKGWVRYRFRVWRKSALS